MSLGRKRKKVVAGMVGALQGIFGSAPLRGARRAVLTVALGGAALWALAPAFIAPAPALDARDQRKSAAASPLPMFKDPQAALRAGIESYHAGNAKNSVEALRYAADGGESLAQWKLGRMYADGDGVARDDAIAYDYFSKLVEHFLEEEPEPRERSMAANAFVSAGLYALDGVPSANIASDKQRAFDLFRYAATYFSNAEAQYNLARMYIDGVAVKKDVRQGVNWLDLAARKNYAPAQALLGQLIFKGEAGAPPQRARGLMYLTLAREQASGGSDDQWIIDMHSKAVVAASDADRKAAVEMLEHYLKNRD
jgi:TPR repeat protein